MQSLMAGKAVCTLASLHENASKRSILFWLETRLSTYKYLHVIKPNLERRLLSFSLRWNGPCVNIPSDSLTARFHIWEVISISLIPPSFVCVLRGQESHSSGLWGHLVQTSSTDTQQADLTPTVCAAKACATGLVTKDISLNQPPSTRWPRNHFLTQHFLLSSTHADSTLYRTNIEINCGTACCRSFLILQHLQIGTSPHSKQSQKQEAEQRSKSGFGSGSVTHSLLSLIFVTGLLCNPVLPLQTGLTTTSNMRSPPLPPLPRVPGSAGQFFPFLPPSHLQSHLGSFLKPQLYLQPRGSEPHAPSAEKPTRSRAASPNRDVGLHVCLKHQGLLALRARNFFIRGWTDAERDAAGPQRAPQTDQDLAHGFCWVGRALWKRSWSQWLNKSLSWF